ncbi:ATP-binding cassette domain-containing protein [Treponema pectinovorum]|uniref:ATP-binding cassette domain-containing protein n=1 Tax=Treponema pectinovorum TaxID=164 RepID=UPI003D94650D
MDIEIKNLKIEYSTKTLFKDFSITFPQNKISALIAPSGWGKTSLLNFIAQNFKNISYCFQDLRILEGNDVFTNLFIPLKNKFLKEESLAKIDFILKQFELFDKKNQKCRDLSGGEKQRVALARAIVFPSKILLLDEPFQNLDLQLKNKLMDFIKVEHKKENRTVILVTHDRTEAQYLADEIFDF